MPAGSPPGLKSSIEYFAMWVGIARTLMVRPTKDLPIFGPRSENYSALTLVISDGESRNTTSGSCQSAFMIGVAMTSQINWPG
jgi:hypothetical protein